MAMLGIAGSLPQNYSREDENYLLLTGNIVSCQEMLGAANKFIVQGRGFPLTENILMAVCMYASE